MGFYFALWVPYSGPISKSNIAHFFRFHRLNFSRLIYIHAIFVFPFFAIFTIFFTTNKRNMAKKTSAAKTMNFPGSSLKKSQKMKKMDLFNRLEHIRF